MNQRIFIARPPPWRASVRWRQGRVARGAWWAFVARKEAGSQDPTVRKHPPRDNEAFRLSMSRKRISRGQRGWRERPDAPEQKNSTPSLAATGCRIALEGAETIVRIRTPRPANR